MHPLVVALVAGILIIFAAVCSGLNVALMSLNVADLKRRAKIGSKQAAKALTIRKHAHFYLSGILITNVAVASATSIVLANSLSGLAAGAISTVLLLVFGEITPQALAVKHAERAVAFFSPAIRFVTYGTYPFTKLLELLLDRIVGASADRLHTRRELTLLISDHTKLKGSELDEDEVEIVQNALQLSEKKVKEIMTPVEHVYHLHLDSVIDARKVDELKDQNWSRVPIFNKEGTACHYFIMLKDLVDIDFDERPIPVAELPRHKAVTIGSMTALDTLFRKFIAAKRHMLIVEKDDKIAGIVTIEDLLEEIIGHEIEDESDE